MICPSCLPYYGWLCIYVHTSCKLILNVRGVPWYHTYNVGCMIQSVVRRLYLVSYISILFDSSIGQAMVFGGGEQKTAKLSAPGFRYFALCPGPSSPPQAASSRAGPGNARSTRSTGRPISSSPYDDRPNPARIHQKHALCHENAATRAGALPVSCFSVRWGDHRTWISQHNGDAAGGPAAGERGRAKGQGCHEQAR